MKKNYQFYWLACLVDKIQNCPKEFFQKTWLKTLKHITNSYQNTTNL